MGYTGLRHSQKSKDVSADIMTGNIKMNLIGVSDSPKTKVENETN